MEKKHVEGKDRGDIFLYTLSTCIWCKRMKGWLDKEGLAYSYVDVDLESPESKEGVMEEVRHWNPRCSFPTVVVNGKDCFVGFKPEKLEELLK
jgi:glutaredoxin-like protein NrdH